MKKDNSTVSDKVMLRREAMRHLDEEPVILEAYAGYGEIFNRCYSGIANGAAFDKDEGKAEQLAIQRPTWSVYCADVENAVRGGAAAHLRVNFLDLDPYGSPWETAEGFFASERPFADRLVVAVNDGLRQKVKLGGAWSVGCLQGIVKRYGNNIHDRYLAVCRELMQEKAAMAGYAVDRFSGYYCGHAQQMTHYFAMLTRA